MGRGLLAGRSRALVRRGVKAVVELLEEASQDEAAEIVYEHLSQRSTDVEREAASVTSTWRFGFGAATA